MQHILLLHGATGSAADMEQLAAALQPDYAVHTLNFSGHGGEEMPIEDFSMSLFAGDVLNYMVKHGISQSAIFGYSMGGYVAMYLAKHYPEKLSRVITLATKFYWDENTAAREMKMLNAATILEKVPDFAQQLMKQHGTDRWEPLLGKTRDLLYQLGQNNTLKLADFPSITIPCLLLLGEKDKMITKDETLAVLAQLPAAAFKELPDTPHPIARVNAAMLAGLIKQFIVSPEIA